MIKKSVVFLSATFLVKITPIVLGFILSRDSGSNAYAGFVSFILFSGLISNISILGANPQIISLKGHNELRDVEYLKITVCGFLPMVCCTALVLVAFIFDFMPIYLIDLLGYRGIIIAFLYSLGLYFLYVSTAKLNNALLTKEASFVWLGYSVGMIFVTIWWFLYGNRDPFLLVSLMAFSSILMGVISYEKSIRSCCFWRALLSSKGGMYLTILRRQLSYSLFGFGVVGIFFYYQNTLSLQSLEEGVFFSLFYQLFALIIFVPSTLGNIVVPGLVNKKSSYTPLKVYWYYFLISFALCVGVFGVSPYLFSQYEIDVQLYRGDLLLILLLVSLIAGVNSYSTQILVARKKYNVLMMSTAIWASISLVLTAWKGINIQSVSVSLLVAYLMTSFGVALGIYKLKYFK